MYKEILGKLTAKQDMTQADVVDCEKWLLVFHSLFLFSVYSSILKYFIQALNLSCAARQVSRKYALSFSHSFNPL